MRIRVLGIVLAGGKGTRLSPLTRERAKPAVPFGGKYRIIDFVLSNFINSGIYSIYVLTQFRSQSLLQHLSEGWQFGSLLKNQFVIPVPAQMRSEDETWYQGTADAIYQNINLVEQADPHVVAIFGGDHIYRMNIASMIEYHVAKSAEVTVAAIPMPRKHADEFGVIEAAEDDRILGFHEKNPDAPTMPGDPEQVYASMGNYIFSTRTLLQLLRRGRANDPDSNHDFGKDILPKLAGNGRDVRLRFPDQPHSRRAGRFRALLARRGDHRGLLRSQHGSALRQPGAQSLQPRVAAAQHQLFRSARQVHLRRREPPRPGHRQHRLRRLHSLRRRGAQFRARPRRARACRRAGGRLRHPGQLRYRAPRQDSPRHPRQERARCRKTR